MGDRITLSVIKADVGGYIGHHTVYPDLLTKAQSELEKYKRDNILIDFYVTNCGDDIELIMTHKLGVDNEIIHKLAWDTFLAVTEVAKKLKLYGAGQDLLSDSFSGNVKGMGPGVAEMEFEERKSEPVIIFMADKCSPGAWNLPLYKIFADPFNTPGLVIDTLMHAGFTFEIVDVYEHKTLKLNCPEELYDLLMFIGAHDKYMITKIFRRYDNEIACSASTQKLSLIAGKYVGKDDPVCIVRSQAGFPSVGEILEPFALPHLVAGWLRGSHYGPLMPVSFKNATPSRLDGPPRIIAAGFQIADGKLIGPRDLFDDPAFELSRQQANLIAEYLRRHGPFEPHRLPLSQLEYTTMPKLMEKYKDRFHIEETKG
ncbi:MAG: fructose-1,6-bisphosphate aldolase/phosphatase [Planctomycetota bacterium]